MSNSKGNSDTHHTAMLLFDSFCEPREMIMGPHDILLVPAIMHVWSCGPLTSHMDCCADTMSVGLSQCMPRVQPCLPCLENGQAKRIIVDIATLHTQVLGHMLHAQQAWSVGLQAQNNIMRAAVAAQQGKAGSTKGRSGQSDALRRLQVARLQLQGQPEALMPAAKFMVISSQARQYQCSFGMTHPSTNEVREKLGPFMPCKRT